MTRILVLFTVLAMSACCGKTLDKNIDLKANSSVAGVAMLEGDTTALYITDFFPSVDNIAVVYGDSLDLSLANGVINVISRAKTPALGVINLERNGSPLTLVYQRNNFSQHKLYSVSGNGNAVEVGFTAKPDKVVALWQNMELPAELVTIGDDVIEVAIPKNLPDMERSYLRVYASKDDSLFSDVLVPLANGKVVGSTSQLTRHDHHAQVIYSLMIDRFSNGNKANDKKLNSPDVLPIVDYMGGDLKGITKKIKSGFFTDLGINTIWVSPITQNPYNAWGLNENPRTKFSGYHGYWPIYTTVLDERFGTEAELKELLDQAHKRDVNVILDYVANHLHIDSPVLKDHPDWTTPAKLADGRENIALWDEQRLTTWFDKHIPTLDLERKEICDPMTDSALHWIANFDFDGFRHDATKHIPEGYWRMLTAKMKERFPERQLYQIGETYGSPQLIGMYVKSGMLNAQFDFNVYDRATWTMAGHNGTFADLAREINNSHAAYGAHNTMGYITGNHDRPRFISLAGGALSWDEDSKAAGWNRKITVGDSSSYDKLLLLEAVMLTIPGVPCIYQGDEYGVPGGNDPDNRHMMQFDGYNTKEQRNRDIVAKLAKMRRSSMPLIYGDYLPLVVEKDVMVFARVYMGEVVVVALNKGATTANIDVKLPAGLSADLKPALLHGETLKSEDGIKLVVPALSFELYN